MDWDSRRSLVARIPIRAVAPAVHQPESASQTSGPVVYVSSQSTKLPSSKPPLDSNFHLVFRQAPPIRAVQEGGPSHENSRGHHIMPLLPRHPCTQRTAAFSLLGKDNSSSPSGITHGLRATVQSGNPAPRLFHFLAFHLLTHSTSLPTCKFSGPPGPSRQTDGTRRSPEQGAQLALAPTVFP